MERLSNHFSAYLNHLAILSEDLTVNLNPPIGRNLRAMFCSGVFGCALFHDLLKSAAILCKVLQDDEVCIVRAIEAILKANRANEKLSPHSMIHLQ